MNTNEVPIKQRLWGWKVATHLFLVGLAAGIYITGSLLDMLNSGAGFTPAARLATIAVIPLLAFGLIFIFSHLGKATNIRRAFMRPGSSWIARGGIALLAFLLIDLIQFFLWIWPAAILEGMPGLNTALQVINSMIALFVLIYSGMLLATLKSFPFWRNWTLPLVFTFSGLTGGLMLLIILAGIGGAFSRNEILTMISWNNVLLVVLALSLLLFLRRGGAASGVKDSVRIMTGVYGLEFYLGAVIASLVVPLFLGILIVFSESSSVVAFPTTVIFTIIGIAGGYTMKDLVLKSGVSAGLALPGEAVQLPQSTRIPASERVHYR